MVSVDGQRRLHDGTFQGDAASSGHRSDCECQARHRIAVCTCQPVGPDGSRKPERNKKSLRSRTLTGQVNFTADHSRRQRAMFAGRTGQSGLSEARRTAVDRAVTACQALALAIGAGTESKKKKGGSVEGRRSRAEMTIADTMSVAFIVR